MTLSAAGQKVFFRNQGEMVCLDLRSGKPLWRTECKGRNPVVVTCRGPTVVATQEVVLSADNAQLTAFSAETGKRPWSSLCAAVASSPPDVFMVAGLVWTGIYYAAHTKEGLAKADEAANTVRSEGLDPLTGEVKKVIVAQGFYDAGHHHRCYRDRATDRYLIFSYRGLEFMDLQAGQHSKTNWVRGGCQYGTLPCNGLIYATPHPCKCYITTKLQGFYALAPESANPAPPAATPGEALQRGPAYDAPSGQDGSVNAGPEDWLIHRHDKQRSGATKTVVPASLKSLWTADIGGNLTPAVICGGTAIVASKDTFTVHALNAATGEERWTYVAGGRIDSPPTMDGGMAYFGSADGYVYCLRASDGVLAWRFRVAPRERRVGALERLESAWPVNGSVLVQNSMVYCAAGRSSHLDGGIVLCALDPKTGRQLHTARLHDDLGEERKGRSAFEEPGALPDILVGDGCRLYMATIDGMVLCLGKPD
jgi:outer membrane protein assembly factor BamB